MSLDVVVPSITETVVLTTTVVDDFGALCLFAIGVCSAFHRLAKAAEPGAQYCNSLCACGVDVARACFITGAYQGTDRAAAAAFLSQRFPFATLTATSQPWMTARHMHHGYYD